MKNIILLAVQGAGKGTVANLLKEKFNYVHISTGDMLRKRAAVGDEFGIQIQELIHNGILVSDEIVFDAIEDRITEADCKNGFILDGVPRTLEQAKRYDALSETLELEDSIVINMIVPIDVVVDRITSRRICEDCAKIYNMNDSDKRPKVEGICDVCGGNVVTRDDDSNAEAVRKRIETYNTNSVGIIDYYKEKGNLFNVDATDTNETVLEIKRLVMEQND